MGAKSASKPTKQSQNTKLLQQIFVVSQEILAGSCIGGYLVPQAGLVVRLITQRQYCLPTNLKVKNKYEA